MKVILPLCSEPGAMKVILPLCSQPGAMKGYLNILLCNHDQQVTYCF